MSGLAVMETKTGWVGVRIYPDMERRIEAYLAKRQGEEAPRKFNKAKAIREILNAGLTAKGFPEERLDDI